MAKRPMTFAPDTLVSSAELAHVIGIDLETINNWLRRGSIGRSPVGGRQMRNRLFSMMEVYKAAFIADLVKLGISPSSAAEAVAELWKQWDGKQPSDGRRLYALVVPTEGKWTVLIAWQGPSGGPLHKVGRSGEIELPNQTFAVLPVSDVLDRVSDAIAGLLGGEGTKNQ
jgi:hypothetical protein